VVPSAPRYDARIVLLAKALDDPTEPMAETCRRVGEAAGKLGLPRPSYVHLRRFIREQRAERAAAAERREAVRAVTEDVLTRLLTGRFVDPYEVALRLREAPPRARS
jgi:hypothetical protein